MGADCDGCGREGGYTNFGDLELECNEIWRKECCPVSRVACGR